MKSNAKTFLWTAFINVDQTMQKVWKILINSFKHFAFMTVSFVSDNKVTILVEEQMGHTQKDGLPVTHSQKPCYHLNPHSLKSVCTNRFFRPAFSWHLVSLVNIVQSFTLFHTLLFTVTIMKYILALALHLKLMWATQYLWKVCVNTVCVRIYVLYTAGTCPKERVLGQQRAWRHP